LNFVFKAENLLLERGITKR